MTSQEVEMQNGLNPRLQNVLGSKTNNPMGGSILSLQTSLQVHHGLGSQTNNLLGGLILSLLVQHSLGSQTNNMLSGWMLSLQASLQVHNGLGSQTEVQISNPLGRLQTATLTGKVLHLDSKTSIQINKLLVGLESSHQSRRPDHHHHHVHQPGCQMKLRTNNLQALEELLVRLQVMGSSAPQIRSRTSLFKRNP